MYKGKEPELRSIIAKQLDRGKVDCVMFFEITGEDKRERINAPVVKGYFDELKALSEALGKNTYASDSRRSANMFQRDAPPMIGECMAKTTLPIRVSRTA